jgi:hypothetical protein
METTQIISWLYDKAARAHDHSYARMLNTTAKRLKELDEKQKWIPVTERLPDEDTRVLVWLRVKIYDHTHMDTDRLHRSRWVRWGEDVTHWMPLPEPPKEEDHE